MWTCAARWRGLDELQNFLTGSDALTEQVLRRLLAGQRPAVVIGTIWPGWLADFNKPNMDANEDQLRAPARAVLALTTTRIRIEVQPQFSPAELEQAAAVADPRLHGSWQRPRTAG
ncbi:hypothetical protein E1258_06600 [Micromonospora sp. KC207]|uniref:hypothetical protein n=1 Tax=Micromonospora sp. KC207 TaxID=2530377 RepID=UPI001052B5DC|nr:hypothetical protein [Micromonospora sp. KC207]TDC65089.1 hypothetical protein E1258_06600 [Micromonospora sp. KC207]